MAYRTTSKACTTTLTKIEPIYINIKIKQIKFKHKHNIPLDFPLDITITEYIQNLKHDSLLSAHTQTNDTFKNFFPSIPIPKFINPDFYTTQFYTGHGHFQKYLHRIQRSNTDTCTCTNNTPQDSIHLIIQCPHYTNIRHELQLHNIISPNQFVQNKQTYTKFKLLCKHIYTHLHTLSF